jgi:two-component system OmpR family response regulator
MPVRVFLVEDMKHMHGVVQDLLATVGDFKLVGTASNEAEAAIWLDENKGAWDLALIDLILDSGSGMGVIARCKAAGGGKVVVLSDYATPGVHKHCIKLGADATFQKGEDMHAFLSWCAEFKDPQSASV